MSNERLLALRGLLFCLMAFLLIGGAMDCFQDHPNGDAIFFMANAAIYMTIVILSGEEV